MKDYCFVQEAKQQTAKIYTQSGVGVLAKINRLALNLQLKAHYWA